MTTLSRRDLMALAAAGAATAAVPSSPASAAQAASAPFTVCVIPDSQFYLDFKQQREAGFPFDARELWFDHMGWISRNLVANGGNIAFVTHVGDIWQHPTEPMDAAHKAEGLMEDAGNPVVARYKPDPRARTVEMAAARQGFEMLGGRTPFSAVPGNHDYDSLWADSRFPASPPGVTPAFSGQLHYGGVKNFNAVLGSQSEFFRGKPWYVSSFNGGANSAQLFSAGGYRFLHIGMEMAPYDDVLAWADGVVARYPGLPTLVTIHDHLNPRGEQKPSHSVDFKAVQAAHNNPEDMWNKFFSRHPQILMVFSGHQSGQSRRVDKNAAGFDCFQVLQDYQSRRQVLTMLDPEGRVRSGGLGDGWLRLFTFDLGGSVPQVKVRTYSTYFNMFSSELPTYAAWYRPGEQPGMTDAEFLAAEEFTLQLDDFRTRFGAPKTR